MTFVTPGAVRAATAVLVGLLVVSSGAFALGPTPDDQLRPVPFDRTLSTGMTYVDVNRAETEGFLVPRAEVYFSQYRFVVGYYGVETAAGELAAPETRAGFGDPLAVFVSDFSTVSPVLTPEGHLTAERGRAVGWTRAEDASFVVDSSARAPSQPLAVSFSARADAEAFADAHGGRVVDWETLQRTAENPLDRRRDRFDRRIAAQQAWADDVAADGRALLDRPVSVVVGADAPTLAAALDRAPPNTTVRLPPGTYDVTNLSVTTPVTIAGSGNDTVLRGNGTDSVLLLRQPHTAVSSLRITGVGPNGTQRRPHGENLTREDWSRVVQFAYGRGDAGVVMHRANGSLVHDVTIETPASGVVVRFSDRAAVVDSRIEGSDDPWDGFMGVVLMQSRALVEGSTFVGGRDAVYTHRADGFVVRDNSMSDERYGVHFMYTSRGLVANNTIRDTRAGIIIMTRPVENVVVGNDVRDSEYGFVPVGGDSYYAHNVLVDNDHGLSVSGHRSVYEGNVVANNGVGVRATTLFPTNWVVRNDVVDNDRQVETGRGPLRTWSRGDEGNYWGPLPIPDADGDGTLDRPYRPTGPVDGALRDEPAAWTVSQAPSVVALRAVGTDVSGLRSAGVVDQSPRASPANPARLANATREVAP
ncbi:NosD domain-containing protein [Salinigranum salinum]|uniref:NosD domain-containing protein n=1 Tax=Salinigranum salinum TaxID=1364937 RepID=UPI0012609285|nr:right-handed parallel beta-helix repeat-containing protein [Salinigranum salinum]